MGIYENAWAEPIVTGGIRDLGFNKNSWPEPRFLGGGIAASTDGVIMEQVVPLSGSIANSGGSMAAPLARFLGGGIGEVTDGITIEQGVPFTGSIATSGSMAAPLGGTIPASGSFGGLAPGYTGEPLVGYSGYFGESQPSQAGDVKLVAII